MTGGGCMRNDSVSNQIRMLQKVTDYERRRLGYPTCRLRGNRIGTKGDAGFGVWNVGCRLGEVGEILIG